MDQRDRPPVNSPQSGGVSPQPTEPLAQPDQPTAPPASSPQPPAPKQAPETPSGGPPSPRLAQEQTKKTIAIIGGAVLSVAVLFWLASSIIPRALVFLTKAANQPGEYSLVNSYIFGSPLLAAANGEEKIRVSVFLLDAKGKGVPDKQIILSVLPKSGSTGTPQVAEIQPMTDNFGKAVYEITSSFAGQYAVTASVNGLEFPQTVTLTFK